MNYMDNRSHFRNVLANLRKMLPWVISAGLIFMGIRMAFATWEIVNVAR